MEYSMQKKSQVIAQNKQYPMNKVSHLCSTFNVLSVHKMQFCSRQLQISSMIILTSQRIKQALLLQILVEVEDEQEVKI